MTGVPLVNFASRRQRRGVILTFPLAFAAHDLEEVVTAARWSETAASRLAQHDPTLA